MITLGLGGWAFVRVEEDVDGDGRNDTDDGDTRGDDENDDMFGSMELLPRGKLRAGSDYGSG